MAASARRRRTEPAPPRLRLPGPRSARPLRRGDRRGGRPPSRRSTRPAVRPRLPARPGVGDGPRAPRARGQAALLGRRSGSPSRQGRRRTSRRSRTGCSTSSRSEAAIGPYRRRARLARGARPGTDRRRHAAALDRPVGGRRRIAIPRARSSVRSRPTRSGDAVGRSAERRADRRRARDALARLQKYLDRGRLARDPTRDDGRHAPTAARLACSRFFDAKELHADPASCPRTPCGTVPIELSGGPFAKASVENLAQRRPARLRPRRARRRSRSTSRRARSPSCSSRAAAPGARRAPPSRSARRGA